MGIEQIRQTLSTTDMKGVDSINQVNKHTDTTGDGLGIRTNLITPVQAEQIFNNMEPVRQFDDASVLLPAENPLVQNMLVNLPPGSIFGMVTMPPGVSSEQLKGINADIVIGLEELAVVVQTDIGRAILTVRPSKVITADGKTIVPPWTNDTRREASHMLHTMLNTPQEASLMLAAFRPNMGVSDEDPLRPMGCISHNKPTQAVRMNATAGKFVVSQPKFITPEGLVVGPNNIIPLSQLCTRLNYDNSTAELAGLMNIGDKISEEERTGVYANAFARLAMELAKTNPTGMGQGTDPKRVLEAMVESTGQLAAAVNEGQPQVGQARQLLADRMGINKIVIR